MTSMARQITRSGKLPEAANVPPTPAKKVPRPQGLPPATPPKKMNAQLLKPSSAPPRGRSKALEDTARFDTVPGNIRPGPKSQPQGRSLIRSSSLDRNHKSLTAKKDPLSQTGPVPSYHRVDRTLSSLPTLGEGGHGLSHPTPLSSEKPRSQSSRDLLNQTAPIPSRVTSLIRTVSFTNLSSKFSEVTPGEDPLVEMAGPDLDEAKNDDEFTPPKDHPFIGYFMSKTKPEKRWKRMEDLMPYAVQIAEFLLRACKERGIDPLPAVSTPDDWARTEVILQRHDGPHLQKIMDGLLPYLREVIALPEGNLSCWDFLHILRTDPKAAFAIKDVRLENLGLTRIPLCLRTLPLPGVEHLSLANNQLAEIPVWLFRIFPNATIVSFKGNRLKSIPEQLCLPAMVISRVDFSANQITELPSDLGITHSNGASPDGNNSVIIHLTGNALKQINPRLIQAIGRLRTVPVFLEVSKNHIDPADIPKNLPRNLAVQCTTKHSLIEM